MPKMKFNTRVKYKDEYHGALEPFEVEEEDVAELQKKGGVLIQEPKKEAPKQEPPKDEHKEEPGAKVDPPKKGKEKSRRG